MSPAPDLRRFMAAAGQPDMQPGADLAHRGHSPGRDLASKRLRGPVNKLHVAALANIVQDVGTDRGILLSETGFQPGAMKLASFSNITQTSLTELTAECCIHWGTVVRAGPGMLTCTACGMVQPTEKEEPLEYLEPQCI